MSTAKAFAKVAKTITKHVVGKATLDEVLDSIDQALDTASQHVSSPAVLEPLIEAQAQRRERVNAAGIGNKAGIGPFKR